VIQELLDHKGIKVQPVQLGHKDLKVIPDHKVLRAFRVWMEPQVRLVLPEQRDPLARMAFLAGISMAMACVTHPMKILIMIPFAMF